MSKVSYMDKNIAHLIGTRFNPTWGDQKTEVEIQINPRTKRVEYKIGPTYLPNVNQVGWHLKGKLDCPELDSHFRPKMLRQVGSNRTLYDLRRDVPKPKTVDNTVKKAAVYGISSPTKVKAVNVNKKFDAYNCKTQLSTKEQECAKDLLRRMHNSDHDLTVEEVTEPMKTILSFHSRNKVLNCLYKDNIIRKINGVYKLLTNW